MSINGITLVVEIIASNLSAAMMLKSPWIPFLTSIPIELASLPLLLLVPADNRVQQDALPAETSSPKSSGLAERVSKGVHKACHFFQDNFLVCILVLPWIPAYFSRHPFILIYVAKKFDTTFADVC